MDYGIYRWTAALDNHEPTREWASGEIEWRQDAFGSDIAVLSGGQNLPNAHKSNFILDDGKSAQILYVTGWGPFHDSIWLGLFPVNPNGATRPDNGRVIDYSTWQLGPRRTYHLKLSSV